jgi:hypothetical protein
VIYSFQYELEQTQHASRQRQAARQRLQTEAERGIASHASLTQALYAVVARSFRACCRRASPRSFVNFSGSAKRLSA